MDRLPDSVDEFTREAAGFTLRFVRNANVPNQNMYNVHVGKKNIGYMCLPPFSKNWVSVCTMTDNKHYFDNRQEAEDYMVRQVEFTMSHGGKK